MALTFDTKTIHLINIFETLTNVNVNDCIIDESTNTVYFIVKEGKIGLAIGKNGENVKNVEKVLKKNVKIFEFSNDLQKFVKNLIPSANSINIKNENGKIVVEIKVNKNDKVFVIGRDERNLKIYKEILQRSHNVSDLIVR
jgi:N utilization substance protein A